MQLTQHEIESSETLARCRRMETRLHKLCERLDVEGALDASTITVNMDPNDPYIVVPGFDVTLSAITKAMARAGSDPGVPHQIIVGGLPAGEIAFYPED